MVEIANCEDGGTAVKGDLPLVDIFDLAVCDWLESEGGK